MVEEEDSPSEEVLRLEEQGEGATAKPVDRLPVAPPPEVATRLDFDEVDDERRSHEPDIDVIIEGREKSADPEEEWTATRRPVPYGWFVLIALVVGAALVVSTMVGRPDGPSESEVVREAAVERGQADEEAEREARALVEEVESTIAGFLAADEVDDLLPHVRHVDRVRPLIEGWYERREMTPRAFDRLVVFEPINFGMSSFWKAVVTVETAGGQREEMEPMLLEQFEDGSVKVDWETAVCHQPMPWEEYVRQLPEGSSMDFRVVLEPDLAGFYSHEFQDEEVWRVFQLSAFGSDDFVFGYLRRGSELEREIYELFLENQQGPLSLLLRLSRPEGARSPRGVEIEEVISPQWLIIEAP